MKQLLNTLDSLVNKVTMYKLLLWGLRILFAISWLFSAVDVLPYGPIRPLLSVSILLGVCFGSNYIFARLYKVAANGDSTNITALLLFFIFQPPKDTTEAIALALAGVIGIASKYVVTYRERHIFNPAAFGAVVIGLSGLLSSRWWIGRDTMFVFVTILGVLLVRKIHRFPMVLAFGFSAGILAILRGAGGDVALTSLLRDTVLSFPIVFLGATMLTEPVTTPPRRYQQVAYGLLVGLLLSSGLRAGSVSMSPEMALLFGNLIVFFVATRRRQPLVLQSIEAIGNTIYQYRFKPAEPLAYKPGQYVELTLPLKKTDFRGNRRSFTIASSPTEEDILFGIKHAQPGSAFKTALQETEEGEIVTANNLAGDFVLPDDAREKLVFIAGGIGITPFRSMLKYMTDQHQNRTIMLFYCVSDPKQIVYKDVIDDAKAFGLKVVYVLTPPAGQEVPASWKGEVGFLTKELLARLVLDYTGRTFYISGPDAMVQANKRMLRAAGIPRNHIKTDYFAGY